MADVQYVTLYLHDGTPVQVIYGTVLYQVYLNNGATLYPTQTPPGSGIPTDPADPFPQYTTPAELAAALAAYVSSDRLALSPTAPTSPSPGMVWINTAV